MPDDADMRKMAGETNQLLGEVKGYFAMWEKNHLEYKGDIVECMNRFNAIDGQLIRVHDYLGRISDAQTESAIRANKFEQILANLVQDVDQHDKDIKKLDERVAKIETQHAKEQGRNQIAFALWTLVVGALASIATAAFGVIAPWAFSHWTKGS